MLDKALIKISNFEWGLVISAILVVDAVQLGIEALDLTVIGILVAVIVTGLIDIAVGCSLFMYCFLRGIKLTPSRVMLLLGGFLLELLPFIGGAPLWTIDVILIMLSVKAEEGSKLAGLASQAASVFGASKAGSTTPPPLPKTPPQMPPPLPKGPLPLPKTPPPLPGTPPPLSREVPPQMPPPLPQENTRPIIQRDSTLTERQRAVAERAENLRAHAEEYRRNIESQTSSYGEQARSGQKYVKGESPQ